jgi:hypothetical protein
MCPVDGSLKEALAQMVEPWMDVLLDGLSPEVFPPSAMPSHLATVRVGGPMPSSPWDACFIRADGHSVDTVRQDLERATPNLRYGGVAGLVSLGGPPGDPAALVHSLETVGSPVEARHLNGGAWLAIAYKSAPGQQDLVGLRRCVRTLERNVDRLELLLADLKSRESSARPVEGGFSLKELVGHLGDLDRDGWFRSIRHALGQGAPPLSRDAVTRLVSERDHNSRPMVEMLVRFRHFRSQSLEVLPRLLPDDWLRPGSDLDGQTRTVADLARAWVREEEALIQRIESMV